MMSLAQYRFLALPLAAGAGVVVGLVVHFARLRYGSVPRVFKTECGGMVYQVFTSTASFKLTPVWSTNLTPSGLVITQSWRRERL